MDPPGNSLATGMTSDSQDVAVNDHFVVVSVVENRSREICICKMDTIHMSQLDIYLLNDTHGYAETMATLADISANEILLHDGSKQRVLTNKIQSRFMNSADHKTVFISRQYFDQDRGADLLKKVMMGDHSVDSELIAKYTVLAGAHCLLRYMENYNGTSFAPQTLRINYCSTCVARMHIDRHTMAHLELLQSNSINQINNSAANTAKHCLFGILNHTKTTVGSRLLRSNIMQPSADKTTIDMRLDMVDMLLSIHSNTQSQLSSTLKLFPDLDKMLTGIVVVPKTVTNKTAKYSIDTCIMIKQVLRQAAQLGKIIDAFNTSTTSIDPRHHQGCNQTSTGGDAPEPVYHNALLHTISRNLQQPAFASMMEAIDSVLTESTHYSKSAAEMRYIECFAIKPGTNGMLDVARKTYLQSVEDIYELAKQYSFALNTNAEVARGGAGTGDPPHQDHPHHPQSHQPPVEVKVSFNNTRGYVLSLPNTVNPLPAGFIQAVLNKKTISCTTKEVASLSDRATEAIEQALLTTYTILQDNLLASVRASINCLFSLVDSLAMFDMLNSFAAMVQHSNRQAVLAPGGGGRPGQQGQGQDWEYTRPVIVTDGPLIIHNGRHPIVAAARIAALVKIQQQQLLQRTQKGPRDVHNSTSVQAGSGLSTSAASADTSTPGVQQFQSNNTLLNSLSNMHIITGCNGSGKTIYIKQVALILVMAHIGCYIPASAGSVIPIRDRILSRLGSEDDLEHNLSSFMVEMREIAYICEQVTPKSLVILDEVGRGTSNQDGIALAFAIVEHLLQVHGCYTLCVTHYTQLASLAHTYFNVRNLHLKTIVNNPACSSSSAEAADIGNIAAAIGTTDSCNALMYTHELSEGLCDVPSGYGIIIAEICGVPHAVIQQAYEYYTVIKRLYPMFLQVIPTSDVVKHCYVLLQKLDLVFQIARCTNTTEMTAHHLENIRAQCPATLIAECKQLLDEFQRTSTVLPLNHNEVRDKETKNQNQNHHHNQNHNQNQSQNQTHVTSKEARKEAATGNDFTVTSALGATPMPQMLAPIAACITDPAPTPVMELTPVTAASNSHATPPSRSDCDRRQRQGDLKDSSTTPPLDSQRLMQLLADNDDDDRNNNNTNHGDSQSHSIVSDGVDVTHKAGYIESSTSKDTKSHVTTPMATAGDNVPHTSTPARWILPSKTSGQFVASTADTLIIKRRRYSETDSNCHSNITIDVNLATDIDTPLRSNDSGSSRNSDGSSAETPAMVSVADSMSKDDLVPPFHANQNESLNTIPIEEHQGKQEEQGHNGGFDVGDFSLTPI